MLQVRDPVVFRALGTRRKCRATFVIGLFGLGPIRLMVEPCLSGVDTGCWDEVPDLWRNMEKENKDRERGREICDI